MMGVPIGLIGRLAMLVINVVDAVTYRVHMRRQERREKQREKDLLKANDNYFKAHDAKMRARAAARRQEMSEEDKAKALQEFFREFE